MSYRQKLPRFLVLLPLALIATLALADLPGKSISVLNNTQQDLSAGADGHYFDGGIFRNSIGGIDFKDIQHYCWQTICPVTISTNSGNEVVELDVETKTGKIMSFHQESNIPVTVFGQNVTVGK